MLNVSGLRSIGDKVDMSWDDREPCGSFAYGKIYPFKGVGEWMGCVVYCAPWSLEA